MARYLVLANQTLGGDALLEELRSRAGAEGATSLHILVPATPLDHYRLEVEGHPVTVAEHRLEQALELFADLPAEISGEVGDEHPLRAVEDALAADDYDAVIVSTLPEGLSRWLGMDLASRLARRIDEQVVHVESVPDETRLW